MSLKLLNNTPLCISEQIHQFTLCPTMISYTMLFIFCLFLFKRPTNSRFTTAVHWGPWESVLRPLLFSLYSWSTMKFCDFQITFTLMIPSSVFPLQKSPLSCVGKIKFPVDNGVSGFPSPFRVFLHGPKNAKRVGRTTTEALPELSDIFLHRDLSRRA